MRSKREKCWNLLKHFAPCWPRRYDSKMKTVQTDEWCDWTKALHKTRATCRLSDTNLCRLDLHMPKRQPDINQAFRIWRYDTCHAHTENCLRPTTKNPVLPQNKVKKMIPILLCLAARPCTETMFLSMDSVQAIKTQSTTLSSRLRHAELRVSMLLPLNSSPIVTAHAQASKERPKTRTLFWLCEF